MNNVYKTTEERETRPAISVITPVYNSEKYLEETLDSILNQTFSNLEIICIDDGSSDNSLAILRKYQKQDNRIKVMTQQHLSVVAAKNNAIQEAQGEFIYLLDSDDVVDKTVLEKSYDAIIADKGDVITCRVRAFGLLDGEIYYWSPTKINMALCNCLPNAALFRKSLFEQSGGFDSAFRKGIEDYDFYLNLMYRQKARFYRIPEILFFYRIKSANESRDKQVVGAVKKELWDTLYKKYPEMRIYRNLFKLKKAVTCLLRNIFSVRNERKNGIKRKVITVLGVKLKVRVSREKLWKDRCLEYQQKREIVLEKLRKEKRQLRVCFLVSENEKWNAQSLYDAMEKSEDFYPFVVVTRLIDMKGRSSFQHNVEFFKNCCKNIEIGFDERTNRSIDLKSFKPDIVFYQQPWDIYENQSPIHILDRALSYYFPYGIGSVSTCLQYHLENFYLVLQRHFVLSEEEKNQCVNICDCLDLNTSVVGHPKLDVYNNYDEKNFQKKYVIYAPHFSFSEDSLLHYGTFDWNGKYILEWAKSHPDLDWVFKPHPLLKQTLLYQGLMTSNEIEKYYQDWADLGIYYGDGNYFDLFKNSRCLITDCGSFLTEYFPTKNPVIHLRNPKGANYSANNRIIMQTYYDVWNIEQLQSYLEGILLNGSDPKREDRLSLLEKLNIGKDSSADKIIEELKEDLERRI